MIKFNISNAELAILSLVAEQAVYGYQIEKIIEERGMREWTEIGFSSIYYLLNKLEKKGWIISRIQKSVIQGPARRVFSITPIGLDFCQRESLSALSEPQPTPSHFQLGLANIPMLDNSEILKALKHYEKTLIQKKMGLDRKEKRYGIGIPTHVRTLFEHSIQSIEAEISWVRKYIHQKEIKKVTKP
jgi:DNA-binding PadR family transcriptional regulator